MSGRLFRFPPTGEPRPVEGGVVLLLPRRLLFRRIIRGGDLALRADAGQSSSQPQPSGGGAFTLRRAGRAAPASALSGAASLPGAAPGGTISARTARTGTVTASMSAVSRTSVDRPGAGRLTPRRQ